MAVRTELVFQRDRASSTGVDEQSREVRLFQAERYQVVLRLHHTCLPIGQHGSVLHILDDLPRAWVQWGCDTCLGNGGGCWGWRELTRCPLRRGQAERAVEVVH